VCVLAWSVLASIHVEILLLGRFIGMENMKGTLMAHWSWARYLKESFFEGLSDFVRIWESCPYRH
jgi:hypothetical protein